MCLQLLIGIRDQSTLLLSWVSMALTMVCGLATEAWSRPDKRETDTYRGWRGDPLRTERIMMLESKKRAYRNRNRNRNRNLLLRPEMPRVYPYEQAVNRLPFRQRDGYGTQPLPPAPLPPAPLPLTFMERRELRAYARAYTRNFLFRLIPHFIGWVPYVACWAVYFTSFFTGLEDLRQENEALFERVPDFVPWAIGATAVWFTSFTFVSTLRSNSLPSSANPCMRAHRCNCVTSGSVQTTVRSLSNRACTHATSHGPAPRRLENGIFLLLSLGGEQDYARLAPLLLRPAVRLVQRGDGGHARQPGGVCRTHRVTTAARRLTAIVRSRCVCVCRTR